MFIELAEILDCPSCNDGFGLVAFVSEADRRRVLAGRLGCPICEIEFPIAAGAIRLGEPGEPVDAEGGHAEGDGAEMALRLAALMGVAETNGSAVLLGPGLGEYAARLAAMSDRIEVLAVMSDETSLSLDDLESGVNPLIGLTDTWPVRSGALDGVALKGGVAAPAEARRCLAHGRRLVVIQPRPDDLTALEEAGFSTLASDSRTWVGARS
ncbi:MAG: hypothetical protein OEU54_03325 [Gemmatimonadota bacterium]|nr:hypothetical protein [Gemmatimonadota bacterium]